MFRNRKVYIAGPMTGLPDANRAAFFEAAKYVADRGGIALNPATQPDGLTYCQYMIHTLTLLDQAEAVIMLQGYQESPGAAFEFVIADRHKRVPVYYYPVLKAQEA